MYFHAWPISPGPLFPLQNGKPNVSPCVLGPPTTTFYTTLLCSTLSHLGSRGITSRRVGRCLMRSTLVSALSEFSARPGSRERKWRGGELELTGFDPFLPLCGSLDVARTDPTFVKKVILGYLQTKSEKGSSTEKLDAKVHALEQVSTRPRELRFALLRVADPCLLLLQAMIRRRVSLNWIARLLDLR